MASPTEPAAPFVAPLYSNTANAAIHGAGVWALTGIAAIASVRRVWREHVVLPRAQTSVRAVSGA